MGKQQLTKREIFLIYFLVILVIVTGGWYFLLKPALDENTAIKSELETLEMEKANKQISLASFTNIDENLEKAIEGLTVAESYFYNPVNEEDIDKLLTELVKEYGFTPYSLTMTLPEYKDIIALDGTVVASGDSTNISTMEVTQVVKTNKFVDIVGDYVNAVNEINGVYINSISYSNSDDGSSSITFTYSIYIYNK